MAHLKLDSIAVDCPDPKSLAAFYAGMLNVEPHDDYVQVLDGRVEIWFQQVDDYQAPTWPTQERGQQVHFDFVARNIPAAARRAVELGAIRPKHQPGDGEWEILLDPVGHPFCIALPFDNADVSLPEEDDIPVLAAINFDCADAEAEWNFYRKLADLKPLDVNGMAPALVADTGLLVLVQQVENYQPTTWPSQERGQQIHIDFHTTDRDVFVTKAEELGAFRQDVQEGFTVMKDPQGHPFCICVTRE